MLYWNTKPSYRALLSMHFLICKSKIARPNATGRLSHAFIYERLPTTFLGYFPAEGSINSSLSVRESISLLQLTRASAL